MQDNGAAFVVVEQVDERVKAKVGDGGLIDVGATNAHRHVPGLVKGEGIGGEREPFADAYPKARVAVVDHVHGAAPVPDGFVQGAEHIATARGCADDLGNALGELDEARF